MPSFMEIKSGDWTVKAVFASVALVLVGGYFTIYNELKGEGVSAEDFEVILKCNNPACDYTNMLTAEDFNEMCRKRDEEWQEEWKRTHPPGSPMPGAGGMMMSAEEMGGGVIGQWGYPGWPLMCAKCGENAVFAATKCEKCGAIFLPYDSEGQHDDRCPCGYSRLEERRKKAKEERQKGNR